MLTESANLLLLDPGKDELAAALDQAAQAAGMKKRGQQWRAVLAQVAGSAEGRTQLEHSQPGVHGQHYVSVAWWTDHQGRKHVRVAGGNTVWFDWHPHYSQLDDDLRPPLWHAYPGRVFRVMRPGQQPAWRVSCACGATGEPRALAWMGPRCGPCHDRVEEGQPHPAETVPVLLAEGFQTVYAMAFAPDGRRLAVSSSYRCVGMFSLDGEPERRLFGDQDAGEGDEIHSLVFSHDGRFLAGADPLEWYVRVWDLESGDEQELDLTGEESFENEAIALAFSPCEHLLAACLRDGRLAVWRFEDGTWERAHAGRRRDATALTFSPDGAVLAVGRERGLIDFKDASTWKVRRELETHSRPGDDVLFAHYVPDNQLAVITGSQEPEQARRGHALRVLSLGRRYSEQCSNFSFPIGVVAASPCGRYLAWVVHDEQHSAGEVVFRDLQGGEVVGRLEWCPEDPIRDLDFSPDGQVLVTGSSAGVVKFWPWRLLLEV